MDLLLFGKFLAATLLVNVGEFCFSSSYSDSTGDNFSTTDQLDDGEELRRYLLQPALEIFSQDGRNHLLAFPPKGSNKVYQRLLPLATLRDFPTRGQSVGGWPKKNGQCGIVGRNLVYRHCWNYGRDVFQSSLGAR